jgi:hypothetical protein
MHCRVSNRRPISDSGKWYRHSMLWYLGKDFFEKEKAKIDYSCRQVIRGIGTFEEDREINEQVVVVCTILKLGGETIVRLWTGSPQLKTG